MKRVTPFEFQNSVVIDIDASPVLDYTFQPNMTNKTEFLQMDSHSDTFLTFIRNRQFDLIFIDGDHSYEGVRADYERTKDHGRIFVFHDIVNNVCPGVVQFWNKLKSQKSNTYDFYEFTEQYDEVWQRTGQQFLGIGVAVKKTQ